MKTKFVVVVSAALLAAAGVVAAQEPPVESVPRPPISPPKL